MRGLFGVGYDHCIFVAEGDGVDALGEKVALKVGGKARIAGIVNETSDGFGELEFLIGLLKEDGTGIGLDGKGMPGRGVVAEGGAV